MVCTRNVCMGSRGFPGTEGTYLEQRDAVAEEAEERPKEGGGGRRLGVLRGGAHDGLGAAPQDGRDQVRRQVRRRRYDAAVPGAVHQACLRHPLRMMLGMAGK